MYDNPQQCINARQGVPELPTEAELCQSFNSNKEACIAARDTCVHDHKDKEAIIKCVHDAAVAAAAAKLPAAFQAKLCLLFHGNTEACETAIRVCWAKYEHDKRRMLWCVNAAVKQRTKTELCAKAKQPTEPKLAARADLPTEAELCSPFNGETNACKDATRECYEKDKHLMSSKKAIIKCVHAAAAAKRPTNEELCPPFNGNMEACTNARSYCTYKRKITREAMIKCVHDIAAKGPTDPAKEFDDSPIWSF
ncbi:metallothionein-I transcription activator [Metarhizium brunneum]